MGWDPDVPPMEDGRESDGDHKLYSLNTVSIKKSFCAGQLSWMMGVGVGREMGTLGT